MSRVDAPDARSPWLGRGLRLLVVAVGLGLWFGSQYLVSLRESPESGIGDSLLDWTAPIHSYLLENKFAADLLLTLSSLGINIVAVFLLGRAIWGPTVRPFIGLLMLFGLRQMCQMMVALPTPAGMIWDQPVLWGWAPPGLLVTYKVANDFFFSGHTAMAVFGAIEIARLGGRGWLLVAALFAFFETATVVVLRAHWTMDVYAAIVTAFLIAIVAAKISPPIDRALERLTGRTD